MKNFEVKNIKCQNCANTIKNYFEDEFSKVDVDVEKGIVSLELDDKKIKSIKNCERYHEEDFNLEDVDNSKSVTVVGSFVLKGQE